jgi:low affinity Fe/Cu permease
MTAPTAPPPPKKNAAERKPALDIHDLFRRFASAAADKVGTHWAFGLAVLLLILWAASYPLFRLLPNAFDTWQLVINTVTTIVTFLMVFLIQNSQNRDSRAVHLKLDELIRAAKGARNKLVDLENCTDEELEELQKEFARVREKFRSREKGNSPSTFDLRTRERPGS